jgi:hypothetical protein
VTSPPTEPASGKFDEAVARRAILALVERQRTGTERFDMDLLLRDVAPPLHAEVRRDFAEMQASVRNMIARIMDVTIEFDDEMHASIAFHSVLSGIRISDGRRVTIYDGVIEWDLERSGDRWLIVAW